MCEFLRSLALVVAPVLAERLLDVAIEERRRRELVPRDPESFAAYAHHRRRSV